MGTSQSNRRRVRRRDRLPSGRGDHPHIRYRWRLDAFSTDQLARSPFNDPWARWAASLTSGWPTREPSALRTSITTTHWGDRKGPAAKLNDDGQIVQSIGAADLPIYEGGVCSPTAVALFDDHLDGNGDVRVADGYGQSYLHRYDRDGNLLACFRWTYRRAGSPE